MTATKRFRRSAAAAAALAFAAASAFAAPPDDAADALRRAREAVLRRQYDDARALFERALERAPGDGAAWIEYSRCLSDAGLPQRAAKAGWIAVERGGPRAWRNLGNLFAAAGAFAEARAAHERDLADGAAPEEKALDFAVLAARERASGRLDDALADARRSSEIVPGYVLGRFEQAKTLIRLGRGDDGRRMLEQARIDAAKRDIETAAAVDQALSPGRGRGDGEGFEERRLPARLLAQPAPGAAATAAIDPTSVRAYGLGGARTMTVALPEEWTETITPGARPVAFTLVFAPRDGEVWLQLAVIPADLKPEQIAALTAALAGEAAGVALERELPARTIVDGPVQAVAVSATDSTLVGAPVPAGQYLYLTSGAARFGGATAVFTWLANERGGAADERLAAILRSLAVEPTPTTTKGAR